MGLINFGVTPAGAVGDDEPRHKVDLEEGVPNGIRVVSVPNSGRPLSGPATSQDKDGRARDASRIPPLASFSDVFRDMVKNKALACRNCSAKCNSECYESTKNVQTKSKLDCILKLIELPFGEFMLGSAYKTGKSSDHDSDVNKDERLQTPPAEAPEILESDGQSKQAERTEKIQNGDTANQEPPLKRKRVNSLPTGSSSLMKQAAMISATVGPDIAAAAAQAAVAAICNETSCPREIFDVPEVSAGTGSCAISGDNKPESSVVGDSGEKDELIQAEAQEGPPSKTVTPLQMRAATAAALGAAAAHAKLLADQEEREIEHLVATLIETQMKKVQNKMKNFDALELIMEKEYAEMEHLKEGITSSRVEVLERALSGGISRWRDHPSLN